MQLKDVIDQRIIDLNMDVKTKEEAIYHLTKLLKEADYIEDVESFVKDIYEREALGITGIGNFIAIPHGKSDSVTQVGIAMGKCKNVIPWETLDDEGVTFIFLFAVSNTPEYAKNHMRLLADIAGKLGNDEATRKLLLVENVEDLFNIFED